MHRARAVEHNRQPAQDRGAESSAPRCTPLTLVAGAVAGDDLGRIATTVAGALGCPVAIAIPALGEPVIGPAGSLAAGPAQEIGAYAAALVRGESARTPQIVTDAVQVRIGKQTVGIVTTGRPAPPGEPDVAPAPSADSATERRSWLEAAAAAASVTALIREAHGIEDRGSCQVLLAELAAGLPHDLPAFLTRTRRLGRELGGGATAICARRGPVANGHRPQLDAADRQLVDELQDSADALIAELGDGQIVALVPLSSAGSSDAALTLADLLRARGLKVAVSGGCREPALLHQAVHEAQLLAELESTPDLLPAAQEETYRLLVRVLLRDPDELQQLRDQTITPLADYDARHDTELLTTLGAFLVHDGSTIETAEAMRLHRHTVGYRLSRVREVSGLSPYESGGRERLSLGIKAHQILDAEGRLRLVSLIQ